MNKVDNAISDFEAAIKFCDVLDNTPQMEMTKIGALDKGTGKIRHR